MSKKSSRVSVSLLKGTQDELMAEQANVALRAVAGLAQRDVVAIGVLLYLHAENATEGNPRSEEQILAAIKPLAEAHRDIKCWFEAIEIRRKKNEAERN